MVLKSTFFRKEASLYQKFLDLNDFTTETVSSLADAEEYPPLSIKLPTFYLKKQLKSFESRCASLFLMKELSIKIYMIQDLFRFKNHPPKHKKRCVGMGAKKMALGSYNKIPKLALASELKLQGREDGASLVAVLVALGLTGIIATVVSSLMEQGMAGKSHFQNAGDREVLRRMMVSAVSCEDSLTPGICSSPGAIVPLRRRHSNGSLSVIASSSGAGTKYGKFTVRAECNATGDGLIIRAVMLADSGTLSSTAAADFRPDPLTKRVETWQTSKSLLMPDNVELCSGFETTAVEPGINVVTVRSSFAPGGNPYGCGTGGERAREATATCPAGQTLIGGGARCEDASPGRPELVASFPFNTDSWRGACCASPATSYALCKPAASR